jgi:alpha-amylase/alpha-mannosidase (GH57 family)
VRLCLIWKLHQLPGWNPKQSHYTLPWARIQTLRAYAPLLKLAAEAGTGPLTLAPSPDLLHFLEHCVATGKSDTMLDLHCKPAEHLQDGEIHHLLSFAFDAASPQLSKPFPRYAALFEKWQAMRGNIHRLKAAVTREDVQDLQVLTQLAWMPEDLQQRANSCLEAARWGDRLTHEQAVEVAALQLQGLKEFRDALVRECHHAPSSLQKVECLAGTMHQCILPLLAGEIAGFECLDDARAHVVRGTLTLKEQLGEGDPVVHMAEGALCTRTAALLEQCELRWGVVSSQVLEHSLGHPLSAAELTSTWSYKHLSFLFVDSELTGRFRFLYPQLSAEAAFADFCSRVRTVAQEVPPGEGTLVVEIRPMLGPQSQYEESLALWRKLLRDAHAEAGVDACGIGAAFRDSSPRRLSRIVAWTDRRRGFARWSPESHPLYWRLLQEARREFQNARAWRSLSPEQLNTARDALLALESKDWADSMEGEHDPWTKQRTEELLKANFEAVYRALDLERPVALTHALFPPEVRITSIGPSQNITPRMDGKRSSSSGWIGAGFFRAREENYGLGDSWRQIRELHYGDDGVYVYLRVALPLPAVEMLEQFAVQGVLHGVEGTHSVTWFQVCRKQGQAELITRLAVPLGTRQEEQPLAAVEDVVDLRIPLSALGVRLGEVLRLQVSLCERGNAVAAAPPLGWEEFKVGDAYSYSDDTPTVTEAVWDHGTTR